MRKGGEAARERRIGFGRAIILGLYLLFVLLPIAATLLTSINRTGSLGLSLLSPSLSDLTLSYYRAVLFGASALKALANSLIVSLAAAFIATILGAALAYSLARDRTRAPYLPTWLIAVYFLPPIILLLPLSLIYRAVGIYDTRLGLTLAYAVLTLPLTTLLIHAFLRRAPRSLEDAGQTDGCTRLQALCRISAPLLIPSLAVAASFAFILCWNDFIVALALTDNDALTLQTLFLDQGSSRLANSGETSALAIVSLVLPVAVGLLMRRPLVAALTLGAIRS
jgi:multiple sugar transport system permease protein